MSMGTRSQRRSIIGLAAGLALALAGWASGCHGTGCPSHEMASDDPAAPYLPKKACSGVGDIFKECPLPASVSAPDNTDDTYITIWYYSDPTCVAGFCHYCVTSTTMEDPNTTGAP